MAAQRNFTQDMWAHPSSVSSSAFYMGGKREGREVLCSTSQGGEGLDSASQAVVQLLPTAEDIDSTSPIYRPSPIFPSTHRAKGQGQTPLSVDSCLLSRTVDISHCATPLLAAEPVELVPLLQRCSLFLLSIDLLYFFSSSVAATVVISWSRRCTTRSNELRWVSRLVVEKVGRS